MRSCTANIARLEASLGPDQPGARGLNPHMFAHRHGVVRNFSSMQASSCKFYSACICHAGDQVYEYGVRAHRCVTHPSTCTLILQATCSIRDYRFPGPWTHDGLSVHGCQEHHWRWSLWHHHRTPSYVIKLLAAKDMCWLCTASRWGTERKTA